MATWDLGSLARAAEADIRGGALPVSVEAVGTDSRSLPPTCLFVALRGEHFDGHDFVTQAADAGAVAVMVDEAGDAQLHALSVPRLVTSDTLKGLGDLAAYSRQLHGKPLVAVTGSNGKTTTKEMCAAVLGQRGVVHKNHGNFNNLIGLPLTLLDFDDEAWAGVVEMGMSVPGEIARLAEIATPNVGVITNVAAAHLEGLGSLEAIGEAKGELYAGLQSDAVAIVNADDPVIASVAAPRLSGQRQLSFGRANGCDVRVVSHRPTDAGATVTLEISGREMSFLLPLAGSHNANNAAAAAAVGLALELSPEEIAEGLGNVVVPPGRLRVARDVDVELAGRALILHVIDDTYNANPHSMQAALATLVELADSARCVAVVGDMLELGSMAEQLHRDMGSAAARAGVGWLLSLGQFAEATAQGARDGGAEVESFEDLAPLLSTLDSGLRDGDWVLVKGSRGMRMERVVQHLTGAGEA